MPGWFDDNPADVLRALLTQLGLAPIPLNTGGSVPVGLVTDPALKQAWPCFYADEPDSPDECVTIYDTLGRDDGRAMPTGERFEHFGFQVRIRGVKTTSARKKASQIGAVMDQVVHDVSISLNGNSYYVGAITRQPILFIGKDTPSTKRKLFTINGVVTISETNS